MATNIGKAVANVKAKNASKALAMKTGDNVSGNTIVLPSGSGAM